MKHGAFLAAPILDSLGLAICGRLLKSTLSKTPRKNGNGLKPVTRFFELHWRTAIMQKLERAVLIPKTKKEIQAIAKDTGQTYKAVKDAFRKEDKNECWQNDLYTVLVQRNEANIPDAAPMVWLSIRRNDREPITDWRHKQEIKNQLVGPECEGVEIFPAESRLVDSANQFHLWVIDDPTFRWPFGFSERKVSNTESGGSKQRPTETDQ
jgi:hypothetical protein